MQNQKRRRLLSATLIAVSFAIVRDANAGTCAPVRDSSNANPMQSFENYRQSELACGVDPSALPYILKANPDVSPKGTIVLVHGLRGNPMHVRQMAEMFQKQGYNVVAPILEGHGGNDELLTGATFAKWQKDVKYAGDIAEKLGKPLFIGGHSTGGALAMLEASQTGKKYSGIVALDPALNLSGKQAADAKWACAGSLVTKYETDPLISEAKTIKSYFSSEANAAPVESTPSAPPLSKLSFQQQVAQVKKITDTLVEEKCGKGFPIPPYNTHYTLAGLCALKTAVDQVQKLHPQDLPPMLVVKSADPAYYGVVSAKQVDDFVNTNHRSNEGSEVIQTSAENHNLMPANCSNGFNTYMNEVTGWVNSYGHRQAAEGPAGAVIQ